MTKYPDLTSLNVSLTRDQREYVAERVAEHGYGSASEYVRDLIRRDAAGLADGRLEELALEGIRSGPAVPADPAFFERVRARSESGTRRPRGANVPTARKKRRSW